MTIQQSAEELNRSRNFSIAKSAAILLVVAGHWFTGTILWIPVTVALFVFGYSSALFTAAGYGVTFDVAAFWRRKLQRLGLRYWIILIFLSVLLTCEGRSVLEWQTLVHFVGLSGVLNWLSLPNRSPLGAGLWFFTLLLVFYLAYPVLAKLCQKKWAGVLVAIGAIAAGVVLTERVDVGHELWLTAAAFICGVAAGLHRERVPAALSAGTGLAFVGLLAWFNLSLGQHAFNTVLIAGTSLAVVAWLSDARLPGWGVLNQFCRIENILLEIFLIHAYLFVHPTTSNPANFVLSLVLIIGIAFGLNRLVQRIEMKAFAKPAR